MGAPLWDIGVTLGPPVVPGWPSEGILEDFGHGLVVKVVGTATARDKELLETRLTDMTAGLSIGDGESVLAPVMARLVAARQYEAVSPDKLQPLYIRRPDAVLARERKASGE